MKPASRIPKSSGDRFADSAFRQFTPRSDILPVGAGKHHCTGSLLALMEMEVLINRFMDLARSAEWVAGPPQIVGYSLRSPPTRESDSSPPDRLPSTPGDRAGETAR